MLVLSEDSPQLPPSASAQSIHAATEAARLVGCRVFYIPQNEVCETAEEALAYVPAQEEETPGIWQGYIPSPEWYEAIYAEALNKRVRLLNTLEEHLNVQEFDRTYPTLQGLTPESAILTEIAQCPQAIARLGLPLFVKGAIQSRKAKGWKACVAETAGELEQLVAQILSLENRSRGRVVARKLVRLRHSRVSGQGFPFGREYWVFLYNQNVLGYGYYWEGDDPLKTLSADEKRIVLALAVEAARRIGSPFVAVDIGQLEDENWIVIETGDAQFSGVSETPLLPLWREISQIRLTPIPLGAARIPGREAGRIWIAPDFDDPLPNDILDLFYNGPIFPEGTTPSFEDKE